MDKAIPRNDRSQACVYRYVYVDDILVITDNSELILNQTNDFFPFKKGSVDQQKTYVGTYTRLREDSQGNTEFWNLRSKSYLKEALRIVKYILDESELKVEKKENSRIQILIINPN